MDTVDVKLKLLAELLVKKEEALRRIETITENQGLLFGSELAQEEINGLFHNMNEEKQTFINTVIQCDNMFESTFKEISQAIEKNPTPYIDRIRDLQDGIKRVMDIDVGIRIKEDRNDEKWKWQKNNRPKPAKIDAPPISNDQLMKLYAQNAKRFT